jgi:hypothetical protein
MNCEHCNKPIPGGDLPVILEWGDKPEHLPSFFGKVWKRAIHFNCQESYKESNPAKRGRPKKVEMELIEALPEKQIKFKE